MILAISRLRSIFLRAIWMTLVCKPHLVTTVCTVLISVARQQKESLREPMTWHLVSWKHVAAVVFAGACFVIPKGQYVFAAAATLGAIGYAAFRAMTASMYVPGVLRKRSEIVPMPAATIVTKSGETFFDVGEDVLLHYFTIAG